MKKIYHLKTCNTCQRILAEVDPEENMARHEIKSTPIAEKDLIAMAEMAGSYEALFSRRAMKFRAMGLHEKDLSEADYKKLILEEYTFLKRPVIVLDDQIFVGNAKKTVEAAKAAIQG